MTNFPGLETKKKTDFDNFAQELIPIRAHINDVGKELESRTEEPEIKISSLPTLSKRLHGLQRKRLYVVGARTGMAKTALVLQMAKDIALQDKKVIYISLESTKEELIERMFCNIYEIDNEAIQRGNFKFYQEQWAEFNKVIEKMPFIIVNRIGRSISDVQKIIDTMEPKPDLIVVDYIQMVAVMGKEALTSISEFMKDFRSVCINNNLVGIIVSQVNRSSDGEVPSMAQLKGAGTLEENCDVCILLHKTTDKDGNIKKYHFIVAKNRFGRADYGVDIGYEGKYFKFIDKGYCVETETKTENNKQKNEITENNKINWNEEEEEWRS